VANLLILQPTVASHEYLGRAVAPGTWVVVVIELGQSVIQSIYSS